MSRKKISDEETLKIKSIFNSGEKSAETIYQMMDFVVGKDKVSIDTLKRKMKTLKLKFESKSNKRNRNEATVGTYNPPDLSKMFGGGITPSLATSVILKPAVHEMTGNLVKVYKVVNFQDGGRLIFIPFTTNCIIGAKCMKQILGNSHKENIFP